MPHSVSERLVQDNWRNQASFIVDGITAGSGRIYLIRLERNDGDAEAPHSVKICSAGETTAEAFTLQEPNAVTDLGVLCEARSSQADLSVFGGEGGQGGDGFLALVKSATNRLVWLVFLSNSNPFVEVDFRNGEVWAVSTLDELWRIPIAHPHRMQVVSGNPKGWDRRFPRLSP